MTVIGPVQPMTGGGAQQENFRGMIDHVLSYKPDAMVSLVERRLNARLAQVQEGRLWGGLLVRGEISVPDAYSTGSITVTPGSDSIIGSGTSWPTNDSVNTTLGTAITVINELQDVTPVSMAGIGLGDWLTLAAGAADQEILLVVSVGTSSFKAIPTKTHAAGIAITKSSFVRRQIRMGTTHPFYSIKSVLPGQIIKIDLPWGAAAASNQNYKIVQQYVSFDQNLRMVWSVVNTTRGWPVSIGISQDILNAYNAWRFSSGWVMELVDYIYDEVGRPQYELSPTPNFRQAIPYLAYRRVLSMREDTDTPPPSIPSHMLVHGAIADVMMADRRSPYYDPQLTQYFSNQFVSDLAAAQLSDDDIYMRSLQWAASQYNRFIPRGADWHQSHDDLAWSGFVGF